MAARYPLVLNGTTIQELQSGDTIAGVDPGIPSGTAMLFIQAAAPTGWTLSTTHNDKALRIVSGSGGGSGGSTAFSTAFASGNTGATTLTTAQIPSHTHTVPGHYGEATSTSGACTGNPNTGSTTFTSNATGGGGSHTHSLSLAVQYVDAIICTKN